MFSHILVPLDGSDNSKSALKVAIRISRYFGSTLTLIAVIDRTRMTLAAGNVPMDIQSEMRERAASIIDEGKKMAEEAGIDAKTIVEDGAPKNVIVDTANKKDFDLVVIGKSGVDAFNRLLIGSTTAYVVRHANVQVLVVNAEEKHK
ncbi:universal stress protein UspA [Secundilactobacillus pentosiphilus]|uniref:Universal stress protein n=1 Tax=Secundilactobacillus pentosiphilus TaxID=1714682 RepID=A0A1Z5IVZ3_9LACO|nr:universal stress protein [Secundilactobacillus pentosiphilus]GAX04628.1 universal stress protein UspA [Secundilactobacillus pentosiphilus]GAX05933.1 universal stress protein UspA [Secundilactobacillus pentosiphilus]